MKSLTAFCIFSLVLTATSYAQQLPHFEWEKVYDENSTEDHPFSIVNVSPEGTILLGGDKTISSAYEFDFWIVKVNENGSTAWSKTYPIESDERIAFIVESPNNTYLIGGTSSDINGESVYNYQIVKIDEHGDVLWQQSYGGSEADILSSAVNTADGGYLLAGTTTSSDGDVSSVNNGKSDIWIVKIDSEGNLEWEKQYGGSGSESIASIKSISNVEFLVAGTTSSADGDVASGYAGGGDIWLVKIGETGNILWEKTFGGSKSERLSGVELSPENDIILLAHSSSSDGDIGLNKGETDIWIAKVDSEGDMLWEKTYGGTGAESSYKITTFESGYLVLGRNASFNGDASPPKDGSYSYPIQGTWLLKLSGTGEKEWDEVFPNFNVQPYLYHSRFGRDFGVVDKDLYIAGGINPPNESVSSGLLFKLNINSTPSVTNSLFSVTEGPYTGTTDFFIETNDEDGDSPLSLTIVSGDIAGDFTVNTDGNLIINSPLDFETTSSYSLNVEVSDGKHSSTGTLTIEVEDVNEPPTDLGISASGFPEKSAIGFEIGSFSTVDEDISDTHTYSFAAGEGDDDNAKFTIEEDRLLTNETFNFEEKSSYTARIQTEDAGGEIFSKAFQISVLNLNETPADISLSATSIDENSEKGTAVGTLSTVDVDGDDSHLYTLSDVENKPDNAYFQILGSQLLSNNTYDFELKSAYEIEVITTDSGEESFTKTFTISINDLNESPSATAAIFQTLEDTPVKGTLTGSDPENSALTFSIETNPAQGTITIDGASGAFTFTPNANFSGTDVFAFKVNDAELVSETASVTVSTDAVNDEPTDISVTPTAADNSGGFLKVDLALSTTDVDIDQLTYSLVAGDGDLDNSLFSVQGATLSTMAAAFANKDKTYSVRLRTTDAAGAIFEKSFAIDLDYCNNTVSINDVPTSVALSVYSSQAIGLVSNEISTGRNKVVWEKGHGYNIDKYNLYKEGSSEDVYSLMGSVSADGLLEFTDNESDAAVKSFKYKVSVVDKCSVESSLSNFHKTIHLTSSLGIDNDVNLSWNQYIGLSYGSVELHKREGQQEWALLEALSSSTTSYTDKNYNNSVNTSYRLDIVLPQSVVSGRAQETYSRISSNVLDIETVISGAVGEISATTVYPNPTSGLLYLENSAQLSDIRIIDMSGLTLVERQIRKNEAIDISALKPGTYLLQVNGKENHTFRVIKQ